MAVLRQMDNDDYARYKVIEEELGWQGSKTLKRRVLDELLAQPAGCIMKLDVALVEKYDSYPTDFVERLEARFDEVNNINGPHAQRWLCSWSDMDHDDDGNWVGWIYLMWQED